MSVSCDAQGAKARASAPNSAESTPSIIERIQLTRELQAIGFSLDEVVNALAAHDAGGATCESERWRLEAVQERVDARIAELQALRGRIVEAQQACAAGKCMFSGMVDSRR